jgi:hypothetical protein
VIGVVKDGDGLGRVYERAILTAFSTASAPLLNSAERFWWSLGVMALSSSATAI